MDILYGKQRWSIQQVQEIQSLDWEPHRKKKIKIFQSDNGGEFTLNEFKELCKESGIKREFSTPYNPQQNGIMEWKNRTIMEATRVMLHDQYLPMHLWD